MADETLTVRGIHWREAFPFTHLFRSFRIAIHPSKLLLGLILLLLIYLGGRALDAIWTSKYEATPTELSDYRLTWGGYGLGADNDGAASPRNVSAAIRRAAQNRAAETSATDTDNPFALFNQTTSTSDTTDNVEPAFPVFLTFFDYETDQIHAAAMGVLNNNWLGSGSSSIYGGASVVQSLQNFIYFGPRWFFCAHPIFAVLFMLWFFILWSVLGGAIARIAALHVARDEKISVRQALRFSTSKALSFFFAPVIPLIILVGLAALLAVGGLILFIPWVGPIVVGAFFFLALLAAFVMTLVVVGTIGGFNLMYPTVAVEGSDSFDAISRSFSYIFARPWRTIFYSAVALAYGALTYLFVRLFLFIMLMLAHGSVVWFMKDNSDTARHWSSLWPAPTFGGALGFNIDYSNLGYGGDIASSLIFFWVYLTIALVGAYVVSFYFSANTIIYYLLRREVDATDLDDVYVEQADEEFAEPTAQPAAAAAAGPTGQGVVTTESVTATVTTITPPAAPATEPPVTPPAATEPPPQEPPADSSPEKETD
jgi:hypothetical protein